MHYITNLIVKIFKKNEKRNFFQSFFAKLLHIPKIAGNFASQFSEGSSNPLQ